MYVNNFKINLTTLGSGTTATTINIPINMEYQIVDNAELVERVFVDVETEKNINPIIDYEKVRFTPIGIGLTSQFTITSFPIDKIIYRVNLLNVNTYVNTYGAIGFSDDDIKFRRENFRQSFLELKFYDSDNPLSQNLVTTITLYSRLTSNDLEPVGSPTGLPGQPKPANQIPINYILENPLLNPRGFSEGFFIYDYKDELVISGPPKFLYMRASFKNAKDGKTTNMMVKNIPQPIDILIREVYTRYNLARTPTGYFYIIDTTYQGNGPVSQNNVISQSQLLSNNLIVDLYQINAL
jgi:hypothetical protein